MTLRGTIRTLESPSLKSGDTILFCQYMSSESSAVEVERGWTILGYSINEGKGDYVIGKDGGDRLLIQCVDAIALEAFQRYGLNTFHSTGG